VSVTAARPTNIIRDDGGRGTVSAFIKFEGGDWERRSVTAHPGSDGKPNFAAAWKVFWKRVRGHLRYARAFRRRTQ
jgi:hypothetical protein